MEVHDVQQPRRFSNFNQPLSKVLDYLIQKGLLRPLTVSRPPNPNLLGFDPNSYYKFHQVEWKLYFDGAINNRGEGLGKILITPEGETIPMVKKLNFKVTNNMAEYEVCLYGVEAALAAGAKDLLVYGDSLLVIIQANEEWKVKEKRLKPYNGYLKTLMKGFAKCLFIHLARDENQMVDALATLSSMWDKPTGTTMKPLVIMKIKAPCYGGKLVMSTQIGSEDKPWFYDIQKFI